MTTMHEQHVVYGSGPVGTAVIEILLAQGKAVKVVTRGTQASTSAGRGCVW